MLWSIRSLAKPGRPVAKTPDFLELAGTVGGTSRQARRALG